MEIITPEKIDDKQYAEMKELVDICSRQDGTEAVLDVDESFKAPGDINLFLLYDKDELISFINLFSPKKTEAELSAFTHPAHRRRGLFTRLLSVASAELKKRGTCDLLFVCDSESTDGQAAVKQLGAEFDFSEYSMKYRRTQSDPQKHPEITIRESAAADEARLVELSLLSFSKSREEAENYIRTVFSSADRSQHVAEIDGKIAGMVTTCIEDGKSYIHGLCVFPEARGRGIGSALLNFKTAEAIRLYPDNDIELEVMTENIGALSIYKRAGFEIKACYDYFRKSITN